MNDDRYPKPSHVSADRPGMSQALLRLLAWLLLAVAALGVSLMLIR